MRFVAKKYLKSKFLLHIYNFYIILFTTPSDAHCPVSSAHQESNLSGITGVSQTWEAITVDFLQYLLRYSQYKVLR